MTDYPGGRKRLVITVTDETAVPPVLADPDELAVSFGLVGRPPTTKTWPADTDVVHDSTGRFHVDVDHDKSGQWGARARSSSAVLIGVNETTWVVEASNFP